MKLSLENEGVYEYSPAEAPTSKEVLIYATLT